MQPSRKIPQTGFRPSFALYGARARTTLSEELYEDQCIGLVVRLQRIINVAGFTIICDSALVEKAFESIRRIGPLAHLSALLIRAWTAAA